MAAIGNASFEDEILALNPDYDLIFSKNHNNENLRNESPHALEPTGRWSSPHKMKIISKMNDILNSKPLGELPTQHDWEDHLTTETETINLMRKLGLEQSIDRPPDETRTISTVPVNEDVIYMKNGRKKMSIFMGDTYFELKPRSEPSFDLDEDHFVTAEESTTSDFSDDVHIYQPIFDSTIDTVSTSLSDDLQDDDDGKPSPSRVPYKQMDSGLSSESNIAVGWTRTKSSNEQPKFGQNRTTNSRDGSKQQNFNDSGTSSSSGSNYQKTRSNNRRSRKSNWRSLNDSSSDVQDDHNWRLRMAPPRLAKQSDVPQNITYTKVSKESPKLNETVTISKETSRPSDVSNCGRSLYKPRDLFIKKKAMMIQQR